MVLLGQRGHHPSAALIHEAVVRVRSPAIVNDDYSQLASYHQPLWQPHYESSFEVLKSQDLRQGQPKGKCNTREEIRTHLSSSDRHSLLVM